MALWYDEIFKDRTRLGLRTERSLFHAKSEYQEIDIIETVQWGRVLVIDGLFMASEREEFFYHEMIVHPALTTAPSIRRVLVIGGGDGGTVREVLRHPEVEKVLMIEIDPVVVQACKEYLPSIGTAWNDPRLEVRFADGIAYVKESSEEPFDVILLDGSDPVGPAVGLFNEDFYKGCKRMLKEGGVFCLQSESPILFDEVFFQVQATLRKVFHEVHPYLGPVPIYGAGTWSWTWASEHGSPRTPQENRVSVVEKTTKHYNRDIHNGAFALPNFVRERLKTSQ